MDYLLVLGGLILLMLSGDWLVRGAAGIALHLKIDALVIGMTVVSFGTSLPELLVSLSAAYSGHLDISFGNVIGSNIANISLILGLTVLIMPLMVARQSYRIDFWVLTLVTLLLYALLYDRVLIFWEGLLMVCVLILYLLLQIYLSRKGKVQVELPDELPKKLEPLWKLALFLVLGIVGLKYGSDFLVEGGVNLAQKWGVSERIIGLTIISIGTSLPELAASLAAAIKGEQDISIGNLIGSNIFNILAVLGISSLFVDLHVSSDQLLSFDFPVLLSLMAMLYLFMGWLTRGKLTRLEGVVLFGGYVAYIYFIL